MNPQEYELMYRVELRHWWYLGMQKITLRLLESFYPRAAGLKILDAGCGTGAGMAQILACFGQPVGVDISPLALRFCRRRGLPGLACASLTRLPFPAGQFDLVTSLDVLYHRSVQDDSQAALELARVIRPGGRLILRLPAYQWMHSRHDRAVWTARRYTRQSVARLLEASGLQVEYLTCANCFLFPLALVKRLANRVFPGRDPASDLQEEQGWLDGLFRKILELEASLIPQTSLPFGLSIFAVGCK